MSRVLVQYGRCGHELDTARSRFPVAGPAEEFIRVPGMCPACDEAADGQLTARHEAEAAAMRARYARAAEALKAEQRREEAVLKQRHTYELVSLWARQGRELSPWAEAVLRSGSGLSVDTPASSASPGVNGSSRGADTTAELPAPSTQGRPPRGSS